MRELGIASEIDESGRYDSLRSRLNALDRETQGREMGKLGAAPDYPRQRTRRHRRRRDRRRLGLRQPTWRLRLRRRQRHISSSDTRSSSTKSPKAYAAYASTASRASSHACSGYLSWEFGATSSGVAPLVATSELPPPSAPPPTTADAPAALRWHARLELDTARRFLTPNLLGQRPAHQRRQRRPAALDEVHPLGTIPELGPDARRTVSRRQGVQETASEPSSFRVRLSVAEADLPSAEPLTP